METYTFTNLETLLEKEDKESNYAGYGDYNESEVKRLLKVILDAHNLEDAKDAARELMSEFGYGISKRQKIWNEIEKRAGSLLEKDGSLSRSAAIEKTVERFPGLYRAYRSAR